MHGNLLLIFDELGKIYIIEKFYGCYIQEKDSKTKKYLSPADCADDADAYE